MSEEPHTQTTLVDASPHGDSLPLRHYDITRDEFTERFIEPWDREQLASDGMLDKFFVDKETGYDALLHIFCGETSSKDGITRGFGFHLESTAPNDQTYTLSLPNNRLTEASRPRVQKRDFEPYNVPVVIQGHQKGSHNKVKIRDGARIGVNTMFGRAYDAFSIIRTLVDAVENRDPELDTPTHKPSVKQTINARSFIYAMPMLGSQETAPIKIIVEEGTDKIISAVPMLPSNYVAKLGSLTLEDARAQLLS